MTRRRWSRALLAAVAEANPRRQSIGLSKRESSRIRRAEDRDLPAPVRKADCPGCVAARAADPESRWPVGDCGPDCLRRAARLALASSSSGHRSAVDGCGEDDRSGTSQLTAALCPSVWGGRDQARGAARSCAGLRPGRWRMPELAALTDPPPRVEARP